MNTKIIQITAGRGPAECSWVVAKVLKVFLKELEVHQFGYEILHKENGFENGTVQSVTLQIRGKELRAFLQDWAGTIQWVGTSTFRKYNKRKNWFIGFFEIEGAAALVINENEIQFQATRSSGPGGQHVNKTSSAVRATHVKTGLQVLVMDSRSQHQNKKIAIERLKGKVADYNRKELEQNIASQWKNHLELQRGNPIKVFKGTDFKKQRTQKPFKANRKEAKNNLNKQQWD